MPTRAFLTSILVNENMRKPAQAKEEILTHLSANSQPASVVDNA